MSMAWPVRWGEAVSPSAGAALPLVRRSCCWNSTVRTAELTCERRVEAGVVGAGEGGEELRGPGTAVAAVVREAVIDEQGAAGGDGD